MRSAGAWVALGALGAGAFGALDLALAIGADPDPSIARRALSMLTRTVLLHALVGGLAALVLRPVARRLRLGGLACAVAVVAALAGIAWADTFDLGPKLVGEEGRRWRWGALVLVLGGALVLALVVERLARALRRRRQRASGLAGRAALGLALLALLGASARVWSVAAGGRVPPPVQVPGGAPAALPGGVRHVLLVVVDTLRADALSCYRSPHGAPAGSTPNLDRLAERGTLFEQVLAPGSWTLPSVATVLTGLDPFDHGVGEFSGVLAPESRSLPEVFRDAGYTCDAYLGNPLVSPRGDFDRGFRVFDCYDCALEAELWLQRAGWGAARLFGLVHYPRELNPLLRLVPRAPFVETRPQRSSFDEDMLAAFARTTPPDPARPSFVYLQPVGPHDPYFERPATFAKERAPFLLAERDRLRELYAGEVRHLDAVLGELFALYERAGILDDTLVVVTADHGEEFQEHGGWRHGHGLYGEVVHVPWIVAGPGVARGRRIETRVDLMDVAPTVLSLAGLPLPERRDGVDLAPLVRAEEGEPPALPARHFAQLTSRILNEGVAFYSVVEGRWKILREVHDDGPVKELVFDLEHDPLELQPLAEPPAELAELRRALSDYQARAEPPSEPGSLDAEQEAHMRALGYGGGREEEGGETN